MRGGAGGFALIELMGVIVIAGMLLVVAASWWKPDRGQARELAVDQIEAAIRNAREVAASRRARVMVAWAMPEDGATTGVRMAWFRVERGPHPDAVGDGVVEAIALQRWQVLPKGVVLATGQAGGMCNLMDGEAWRLRQPGREELMVHGIILDAQGRMIAPAGSEGLMLRVAEGFYREGRPQLDVSEGGVRESHLSVGRTYARVMRK